MNLSPATKSRSMDYTDQFLRQVAEQKREDQEALEQAKKEAAEQGKEPFSLETLDRLWPSNPDFGEVSTKTCGSTTTELPCLSRSGT